METVIKEIPDFERSKESRTNVRAQDGPRLFEFFFIILYGRIRWVKAILYYDLVSLVFVVIFLHYFERSKESRNVVINKRRLYE